jgi:hypothetical protein
MALPHVDATSSAPNVSLPRLYAIRVLFLLNFVILGLDVWPALLNTGKLHEPVAGVALSFWATLSLLSAVGLVHPLRMLPLLLAQLCYKIIWLLFVALPLHNAGQWTDTTAGVFKACAIGLVLDVLVIPWGYAFTVFVRTRGDRWRAIS